MSRTAAAQNRNHLLPAYYFIEALRDVFPRRFQSSLRLLACRSFYGASKHSSRRLLLMPQAPSFRDDASWTEEKGSGQFLRE